jgi:hypothetical protein
MRRLLPSCLLALLLSLLAQLGHAADADGIPTLDQLKRGAPLSVTADPLAADHALLANLQPAHDFLHLHGATPAIGALLLLLSVIPLFFGWRFLRVALTLLLGYFLALMTWEYGMPYLHQLVPGYAPGTLVPILIAVTVLSAIIGCLAGWFLYQLEMALVGALLGMMVLAIPAMYFNAPVIQWALLAVGVVVGGIAGWTIAPYWAALQTAILGGILVMQGISILTQQSAESGGAQTVTIAIGISAAFIGFVVQVLWIGHRKVVAPGHGHRAAVGA